MCNPHGAVPFLEASADSNPLHRFLILVVFIPRHFESLPNCVGVTFLMIGSDSGSDSASRMGRTHKCPVGNLRYVFGGTDLRPEVAMAQLEQRAQVRETSCGDSDCCFDTGPHDDGNLVVWRS